MNEMNGIMLRNIAFVTWYGMGVVVDHIDTASNNDMTYYISVPEHSFQTNVKGEVMAGGKLATRFQTVLREMCGDTTGKIQVRYKVRKDENWTAEKQAVAEAVAKNMLQRKIV